MPNYSLVSTSRFKPLSFAEMMAPFEMYGNDYREQENALSGLDTKTSVWDNILNKDTDKESYAQYKNYADALEQQSNAIASEGLTPSSRKAVLDLAKRYSSEIAPIEQAYQRRAEQIAEQRKAGGANGIVYSYDASNSSIDDFMKDPSKSYKSVNGNDLLKRSMQESSALASQLTSYGKGEKIDKYTNTFIQNYGLTGKDIVEFQNQVREGNIDPTNKVLNSIYSNIYDSTGVADWNNPDAQSRVQDYILEGMVGAMGKQTVQLTDDYGARQDRQLQDSKNLADYNASLRNTNNTSSNSAITTRALRSQRGISAAKQRDSGYQRGDYIKQDRSGRYNLTDKGYKKLTKIGSRVIMNPNPGRIERLKSRGFTEFVVDKNKYYVKLTDLAQDLVNSSNGKLIPQFNPRIVNSDAGAYITGDISFKYNGSEAPSYNELYNNFRTKLDSSNFDTQKHSMGVVPIESSDAENITNALFAASSNNGGLEVVDFDEKNNKYDTLRRTGSVAGYTAAEWGVDENNIVITYVPIPKGIHDGENNLVVRVPLTYNKKGMKSVMANMKLAKDWEKIVESGKVPNLNSDGDPTYGRSGKPLTTSRDATDEELNEYRNTAQGYLDGVGIGIASLKEYYKTKKIPVNEPAYDSTNTD